MTPAEVEQRNEIRKLCFLNSTFSIFRMFLERQQIEESMRMRYLFFFFLDDVALTHSWLQGVFIDDVALDDDDCEEMAEDDGGVIFHQKDLELKVSSNFFLSLSLFSSSFFPEIGSSRNRESDH